MIIKAWKKGQQWIWDPINLSNDLAQNIAEGTTTLLDLVAIINQL